MHARGSTIRQSVIHGGKLALEVGKPGAPPYRFYPVGAYGNVFCFDYSLVTDKINMAERGFSCPASRANFLPSLALRSLAPTRSTVEGTKGVRTGGLDSAIFSTD